jgi:hypothetical protein
MAGKKPSALVLNPARVDRKTRRKANEHARDQFAALGLFIQNFENVVAALRDHCRDMTMGGQRGILIDTKSQIPCRRTGTYVR